MNVNPTPTLTRSAIGLLVATVLAALLGGCGAMTGVAASTSLGLVPPPVPPDCCAALECCEEGEPCCLIACCTGCPRGGEPGERCLITCPDGRECAACCAACPEGADRGEGCGDCADCPACHACERCTCCAGAAG